MIRKIINWIISPYTYYRKQQEFKRRLKELKERDPFIYR